MTLFSRMHQLRAPWMAWWLAMALVVAPALGRMHEVLHAPGLPHAHAANHAAGHDAHDLFGEHSALECLVLDQLGHGCDFSPCIALLAQTLPQAAPIWSTDPAALPAATTVFEARAPPHVTA